MRVQNQDLPSDTIGSLLKQNVIWLILLVLIIISAVLSRGVFLSYVNILQLLRQISLIAIVTTGQMFVMLTGGLDLAVGSVVALSSCVSVMLINNDFPGVIVFVVPILIGLVIGLFNGFMINETKIIPFVATLAMLIIARGFAFVLTGGNPQYIRANKIEQFSIYGREFVGPIPIPVIIMTIVFLIGYFILYRTSLGQHIYAVGSNEESARLAGVSIRKTKYFVYAICGMFSGLAGLVYASRLGLGSPSVATSYNFDSIIPIVMGGIVLSGGKGSLVNAFVCVLIMGTLTSVMNMVNASPYIQDGVRGLVLLLAVFFLAVKEKN